MSSLSAVEQTQINLSVGAVVVSNYLSYLTMGIVLCATWTYFSKFPNDKWWFKVLVILCVSMCICDTIATGIWTYDWAVANYGNPAILAVTHWAGAAEGFFLTTCGLSVQLFYAWRLWIMSMKKNRILPVVIGCLSISGWCIVCWIVYISATQKLISHSTLVLPAGYIWLGSSVGADVLITGSMIYYLDPGLRFRIELHKTQASYRAPRRFRRLILRTVECNLLSLLAQAITICLFNRSSVGLYYVITDMILAKVYTFSLLVTLNCRHPENGPETSNGPGGFSSSSARGEGGIVELTVLHTSSFPSTRVSHMQQETTSDWQERPACNDNEFDTHQVQVVLLPV